MIAAMNVTRKSAPDNARKGTLLPSLALLLIGRQGG